MRTILLFLVLAFMALSCETTSSLSLIERYEGFHGDEVSAQQFALAKGEKSPSELPTTLLLLRDLISKHPENVLLHREYQDRMVKSGALKEAQKEYREKLEDDRSPLHLYLNARLYQEHPEKGIWLLEAVEDDVEFYWGWYGLAVNAWKAGFSGEAEANLKTALRLQPDFFEAHFRMGEFLAGRDDEAAKESFKKCLKLQKENVDVAYNLGLAYFRLGRFEDANNLFEVCLQLSPDYVEAQFGIGAALMSLKKYAAARLVYEKILQSHPDKIEALFNLGILYGDHLNQTEEAIQSFRKFFQLVEKNKRTDLFLERLQSRIWLDRLEKK